MSPRDPAAGPRLGGQYRDAGRDYSRYQARALFVEQVALVAPQVYEHLVTDVYPAYRAARDASEPSGGLLPPWALWSFGEGRWDTSALTSAPALLQLRQGLYGWVRTFRHLEAAWVLDTGLRTLNNIHHRREPGRFAALPFIDLGLDPALTFWLPDPQSRPARRTALLEAFGKKPLDAGDEDARQAAREYNAPRQVFEHSPWHPQSTPRDLYRAQALRAFGKLVEGRPSLSEQLPAFKLELGRYMNDRERAARNRGLERSPRTNLRFEADEAGIRVFRRLAYYCGGESSEVIAAMEGVGARAVQRSNRRTAKLIGLPW